MSKTLYLIRHGESLANAKDFIQGKEGALSETGKKQTEFLARRFLHLPVDVILSSHYERAEETAQIIEKIIDRPREVSELLSERRHPSVILDQSRQHPDTRVITETIFKNYHQEDWRHSDEENFFDLRERAVTFLQWLEAREEKYLLAVTHGFFLRVLLGVMAFGKELDAHTFVALAHFVKTKNTGLTVCEHQKETGWRLLTWNDHAHLG